MIASVLAEEIQLYHELIRPYERSVYVMALSYMKTEADAEDVAKRPSLKRSESSRRSVPSLNSARGSSVSRSMRRGPVSVGKLWSEWNR